MIDIDVSKMPDDCEALLMVQVYLKVVDKKKIVCSNSLHYLLIMLNPGLCCPDHLEVNWSIQLNTLVKLYLPSR